MILRLHRPPPPLDRFVELVTYFEGYDPGHTKERLLPDGAVEIIIDLTESPKKLYDRDDLSSARSFRKAWISGMRRDWIVIGADPGSSMAVIRFRPGGAYPFLGFNIDGITGTVDELDTVLGEVTASLRDRILATPTVDARLAAIDAWLLERGRPRLELNPVVEYLTGRLFAPAGIRITDVLDEVGYSQRHVSGLFRRWVGLPPKPYSRIRRFQQMLGAIAGDTDDLEAGEVLSRPSPGEPDWAEVALTHGYYDQSHLVNDFREFSGLTPGTYISSYRGLANYLPMD